MDLWLRYTISTSSDTDATDWSRNCGTKRVWNQTSKQRLYPTPLSCEILQPCPASYAPGKCWQLIWGASFGVQFGSGKTGQQLVSTTFVGQPVGHTSPNIVDFWGEGNKDGIEMLGNISNVFFGGASWDESQGICYFIYVFVLISSIWKELEFKVGFQHLSKETRLSALYPTSIRSKTYLGILGTWFVLIRFLLDLKIRISIPNLGNRNPPKVWPGTWQEWSLGFSVFPDQKIQKAT